MDTNVLSSIILLVIYFGVGYISTLVIDTSEEKGHHNKPREKIFSTFLWPVVMIGYWFTSFDNK